MHKLVAGGEAAHRGAERAASRVRTAAGRRQRRRRRRGRRCRRRHALPISAAGFTGNYGAKLTMKMTNRSGLRIAPCGTPVVFTLMQGCNRTTRVGQGDTSKTII